RNHILIIEPTTTAWMYYNPTGKNEKMMAVKTKFESFLKQLEHNQVEYDLGSENIIKDQGHIQNGKFSINKADYDWVILPPGLENLDESTFNLLKDFAENGGKVWQIDAPIQYLNGSKKSFADIQKNENWKILKEVESTVFSDLAVNENIQFENVDSIRGRVFHQRREFEDGQLLFLTNFDKNETAEIKLDMPGRSVIHLNPADGKIEQYNFKRENKRVRFSAVLPPSGSCMLFISGKTGKSNAPEKPRTRTIYPSGELTVKRVTPNILNLDYVELTTGKYKNEPMYFYAAANEIWKQHGFPDNPWASSSQFKTELADADTFTEGTGFTVSYPFVVDENFKTQKMQLVVERPWLYQITVNGKSVTQKLEKFWLDPDFHRFEIGNFIHKGNNKITLTASRFSMYCELEPVYLLGDFSVVSQAKGWKLVNDEKIELGSWKKQGMPFYGQTVSYTKQIRVTVAEDFIITVPEWKGTVAEILIDNKHQGVIYSKPYQLKIRIPYGQHDVIVRITGSLKNTLGPHHNFTTPGIVTPASFKTAPAVQPAGEKYDLLDYGLMKDFEIYKLSEEI
ncbi:MAG TPA: hypothetical protein VKA38_02505, partial [Draconibacterium sp.]|nr:hypothetical protein [Draconibacterium sp.]